MTCSSFLMPDQVERLIAACGGTLPFGTQSAWTRCAQAAGGMTDWRLVVRQPWMKMGVEFGVEHLPAVTPAELLRWVGREVHAYQLRDEWLVMSGRTPGASFTSDDLTEALLILALYLIEVGKLRA